MSFLRKKHRALDKNVNMNNNLTVFTNPPIYTGDLIVQKNEFVGGDLEVSGNLIVRQDIRAKSFYATGNYYLNNYILVPYGTIIQSAAITIPDGWLVCNGSSISTLTYINLFGAIGYAYGGSGNNFNVPDLRGRSVIGSGSGAGLTTRNLGDKGGEESHILTTDEMPSHSHTSNATGGTIGLITSDGNNTAKDSLDFTLGEPNLYAGLPALTINNTGSGNAHNNMQPYIVLNYLIKY